MCNICHSIPFSQTQGPSGPIYASSNPEYLSANDGEQTL